jgi:hypothetical protein
MGAGRSPFEWRSGKRPSPGRTDDHSLVVEPDGLIPPSQSHGASPGETVATLRVRAARGTQRGRPSIRRWPSQSAGRKARGRSTRPAEARSRGADRDVRWPPRAWRPRPVGVASLRAPRPHPRRPRARLARSPGLPRSEGRGADRSGVAHALDESVEIFDRRRGRTPWRRPDLARPRWGLGDTRAGQSPPVRSNSRTRARRRAALAPIGTCRACEPQLAGLVLVSARRMSHSSRLHALARKHAPPTPRTRQYMLTRRGGRCFVVPGSLRCICRSGITERRTQDARAARGLRRAEATAPAALSRNASVPAPFDDVLQPLQTLLQRGELTDHFL